MREIRSLGSVRGVPGNRHSYRDIPVPPCAPRPLCPPKTPGASPLARAWTVKDAGQLKKGQPYWTNLYDRIAAPLLSRWPNGPALL